MAYAEAPHVTGTGDDVFQSTSFNIPRPASIAVDDLIVIGITFANAQTNNSSVSITGFTSFGTTNGVADFQKWVFYRIATSADISGGNWSCTCSDGFIEQWAIACWTDIDGADPTDAGPIILISASTTVTFDSITPSVASRTWVGIRVPENNSGAQTDPSGPTKRVSSTSAFFTATVGIFTTTISSAYTVSGSQASGFEFATVAITLREASAGTKALPPAQRPWRIWPRRRVA